ncbi:hypothetical protein N7475_004971 [Penicillium sp. IBT 31633x]|nr:hypothetical protein N7475_004971 [Penicillium sp. IBT 31633x]
MRRDETSPIHAYSSISSVEITSPSTQVSSTSELSPNPPRPALGDCYLPSITPRRREHSPDPAPSNRSQRRRISVGFLDVAAHTAKCDECNKRNRNGMARCQTCGWQLCRKCQSDRNGDRTHGSIGATHVAEGGSYTPLPPVPVDAAPDPDQQHRENSENVRAAHTLLELASHSTRALMAADRMGSNGGIEPSRSQIFERQFDVSPTDSEMTVSVVGDEAWPNDDNEVPIGEDGLPIGYVITRRNPARAARPSTMME